MLSFAKKIVESTKQEIFSKVLDYVLPPRCPVTGDSVDKHGAISPTVWKRLNFISYPFCSCCGIPFAFDEELSEQKRVCGGCIRQNPVYDFARAVVVYDNESRPLILGFKHGDKTILTPTFSRMMVSTLSQDIKDSIDVVIPVPLHPLRLLKRRYNQAGLLADEIARTMNKRFVPDMLVRIKKTNPQGKKSKKDREENIRGAFRIDERRKGDIAGKTICLIDDVLTTGATVNACAAVLKKAGAKSVIVLCFARVISHENL